MLRKYTRKTENRHILIFLLALGCLLRLVQYIANYSLWLDEACLALAIINTPFVELAKPLNYGQAAPLGFLYLVKSLTLLINEREYVLRIVPIICGLALLPATYALARKLTDSGRALFILLLVSINMPLIHFSAEFKPYILDACMAVVVLLIACNAFVTDTKSIWKMILLALVLIVSMWFSFTAVFVGAGIIVAEWLYRLLSGDRKIDKPLIVITVVVIVSVVLLDTLFLRNIRSTSELHDYWQGSFIPMPLSVDAFKWYVNQPFRIITYPGGFFLGGLAFFCICIGVIVSWKEKRHQTMLLVSPILITVFAALFRKYPMEGRLILFWVPGILILGGIGVAELYSWIKEKNRVSAFLLVCIFLIFPLYETAQRTLRPFRGENLRPVIEYVLKNKKPQQDIYVYYGAVPAFTYYCRQFNYKGPWQKGVNARENISQYGLEIEKLFSEKDNPVWFLFSHIWDAHGVHEEKYIVAEIEKMAKRRDYFHAIGGASGYLFTPK